MSSEHWNEILRINQETLERQTRIIEILIDMQRTLNFTLRERRRTRDKPDGEIFLVPN